MINIQSSTVAFTTAWKCTVSTHYDVTDIRNTASLKTVPTPTAAHYGNSGLTTETGVDILPFYRLYETL